MRNGFTFRSEVLPRDSATVREITAATGFFTAAEIDIAVELVEERLSRGPRSGYHFLFAQADDQTAGYTTYGPIGCTESSFDLYWIVVHPSFQRQKLGKKLLELSEGKMKELGATRIYIETSSRELYLPTHRFYLHTGYTQEAVIKDFYAPGDAKVIYVKEIS